MEPGPTERHESDTAAAQTPAGGSVASGDPAKQAASGGFGPGDSAAPKPRTRRGWMSDAPLDGGSGWPTSAYAIIKRPDNYLSANGAPPSGPPNGAAPVVPAPPPSAPVAPVERPAAGPKVKLPRQKSWLRGRGWGNRSAASADSIKELAPADVTNNPPAAATNLLAGHTAMASPPTTDSRVDPAPDSIDTADPAPLSRGAAATALRVDAETATLAAGTSATVFAGDLNTTAFAADPTALTTDAGRTPLPTGAAGLTTLADTTAATTDAIDTAGASDTADASPLTAGVATARPTTASPFTNDAADTADATALPADAAVRAAAISAEDDEITAVTAGEHGVDDDGAETVPIDRERAALDLQTAEAIHDLREAMRSLRRPEDVTAARGTAAVTGGPLTDDDKPDDPADHDGAAEEAGTPRWLAIAAAVVILIALALVVYFAIRANGPRTDQTAPANSPTMGAAGVVVPETSSAVSFAPEGSPAQGGSPAPAGSPAQATGADVLRSGSVRLAIGTNQADESFDFDSGIKGAPHAFAGGQQPDLDALTQGLWAANGAHVAVWTKNGSPSAAECRGLPDSDWTSLVTVEPALVGPKVCVQTSEGRAATFTARPIAVGPDGGVETVYLDFTVWKKAGD